MHVPAFMDGKDVQTYSSFDWKAAGYISSIVSVFFLGAAAADKADPPGWYFPVLVIGMATSILGMGFRYLAHLHQKKELSKVRSKTGTS
jgi:hypothetical protein